MKNKVLIILLLTFSFSFMCLNCYAVNDNNLSQNQTQSQNETQDEEEKYFFDKNCEDLAPALKIGNLIIRLVRVIVPFVIIIMGTFKLFSAVLAGDPSKLTERVKDLVLRVVLAVLIFFTPSIINAFSRMLTPDQNADVNVCRQCLLEGNCPDVNPYDN